MVRTFGIGGNIHPINDVRAASVPSVSRQTQSAVVVRSAERECPRLLGLQVAVAELVAGIVIEVGERRHTHRPLGVEIDRTVTAVVHVARQVLVADVCATGEVITERGVVQATQSYRCTEPFVVKSLPGEILDSQPVGTFHEVQHIQVLQIEAVHVGHLSVRVDRVAEVGGVDVLVAQFGANGCCPEP